MTPKFDFVSIEQLAVSDGAVMRLFLESAIRRTEEIGKEDSIETFAALIRNDWSEKHRRSLRCARTSRMRDFVAV